MNHEHKIGVNKYNLIGCLICNTFFTKKALEDALKMQYRDNWQEEYAKLKHEKSSKRAKIRGYGYKRKSIYG